jgi:hypothetical protein
MSNGFTSSDIATLLSRNPHILQRSLKNQIIPSFVFFKNFLGIDENTITAIKRFSRILNVRLDTSVVSNVNLLRENGVPESNIFSFLNRIEFGIVLTEKNNGSRRMGFTGWGMVKGVGHGSGAMGWRGGGEVVIGGNSRSYQWKPKKKKIEEGSRSLVKRLRFTALICKFFFFFFNDVSKFVTSYDT